MRGTRVKKLRKEFNEYYPTKYNDPNRRRNWRGFKKEFYLLKKGGN